MALPWPFKTQVVGGIEIGKQEQWDRVMALLGEVKDDAMATTGDLIEFPNNIWESEMGAWERGGTFQHGNPVLG